MKKLSEIKDWKELINEVVQGDCLGGMKMIPDKSIDLIVTDPPYGLNIASKGHVGGGSIRGTAQKFEMSLWDIKRPDKKYFEEIFRISKNQIIFGGNYFIDFLEPKSCWIIWDKRDGLPERTFADCEIAWTSFEEPARIFRNKWDGFITEGKEQKLGHPTQKPIALMQAIIERFSKETDLICDPFMGSWTTARACKDLGRNFIGFELEEKYCKVGEERLRQQNLF